MATSFLQCVVSRAWWEGLGLSAGRVPLGAVFAAQASRHKLWGTLWVCAMDCFRRNPVSRCLFLLFINVLLKKTAACICLRANWE